MNKKGVATLFKIMLGVTIIILALALAGPLRSFTENARNATSFTNRSYEYIDPNTGEYVLANGTIENTGLGCYQGNGSVNASMNMFQEATCIITDLTLPFFVWIIIGIGGAVLVAKLIIS